MKTKMLSKKIGYWAGVIAIGTVLGLSLQFAKAWVDAPPVAPPGGNVGAPINTEANIQNKKEGTIGLQNLSATGVIKAGAVGNIFTAGDVAGKRLCIGNVCKDAWPDAGTSQTSQWITAGNNVYYNKGNVGIGTNNPTEKLDVNGNITLTKVPGAGVWMKDEKTETNWHVHVHDNSLRIYNGSVEKVVGATYTSTTGACLNGDDVVAYRGVSNMCDGVGSYVMCATGGSTGWMSNVPPDATCTYKCCAGYQEVGDTAGTCNIQNCTCHRNVTVLCQARGLF